MQATQRFSFKALASKIHPPLSKTPRETEQLLSMLTASFQQHLDRHHAPSTGPSVDDANSQDTAALAGQVLRPQRQVYSGGHMSAQTRAKHQLGSILQHPLFSKATTRYVKGAAKDPDPMPLSLGVRSQNALAEDPMRYFNEQVALGMATPQLAGFCLKVQHYKMRLSIESKVTDAMSNSRTSQSILNWLASAEMPQKKQFLLNRHSLKSFVAFLHAENRSADIGMMITQVLDPAQHHLYELSVEGTAYFLRNFITPYVASIWRYDGLERALRTFRELSTALNDRRMSDDFLKSPLLLASNIMGASANFLANKLLLPRENMSESIFDQFTSTCRHNRLLSPLSLSYLKLVHPTRPSVAAMLEILPVTSLDPNSSDTRYKINSNEVAAQMCLQGATLCLDQGDEAAARWLMEFASHNFAQELGLKDEPLEKQSSKEVERNDESESLNLLQLLNFSWR